MLFFILGDTLVHVTTANLLLSFHLTFMSVADVYYRDHFSQIAVQWRHFNFCKIAACFNLIGSEVSLCLLMFLSLNRAYCITFMLTHISTKILWIVISSVWIFWTSYVIVIIFFLNFYSIPVESNICIIIFFSLLKESLLIIHMTFL